MLFVFIDDPSVVAFRYVTQEPEQTEAIPLVVTTPKKKRTKVTDTRLSPRAHRALLQESLQQHLHESRQDLNLQQQQQQQYSPHQLHYEPSTAHQQQPTNNMPSNV